MDRNQAPNASRICQSPPLLLADGYGYDLTGLDVMDAYTYFMKAAEKLGVAEGARQDVLSMAGNARQGCTFANALRLGMS
jgi:hypothetical protein